MNVNLETKNQAALPSRWRWAKLGEVCELNPRRPEIVRDDDEPTSFIPMSAVDDINGVVSNLELRPYTEIKKGYTYFAEGDILFAKITPCMQNGKHAIARGLREGIGFGSTEFHIIRPTSDVSSEWIHKFIRQPSILHLAIGFFSGAVGQQRVPEAFLSNLEIPLPPLAEQKRIAAMLNEEMAAIEKARTAAEAQLEAAKGLPAAYLREVFPKEGEALPPGWRWVNLGEVIEEALPGFAVGERDPNGVIQLRMNNVDPGGHLIWGEFIRVPATAETISKFLLLRGDVVFNNTNSTDLVGKSAVFFGHSEPVVYSNHFTRLRVKTELLDSSYLASWLRQEWQKRTFESICNRWIGQSAVNNEKLLNLEIPLPPLAEQKRIVAILNDQMASAERLRAGLETQLAEINALPAALLRRAFNGEL
jgi:type I restriction enzyme S subunit